MYRTILAVGFTTALALTAQTKVTPPAHSVEVMRAHAIGYQVYACEDGGKWSSSEPVGALVTPNGDIVRHYRDRSQPVPAWEAADGGKLLAVLKDGKPDQSVPSATPNSIPQLGLNVNPTAATGAFGKVSYIVRANTIGGVKPAEPCQPAPGKRVAVKYESDYIFYRPY